MKDASYWDRLDIRTCVFISHSLVVVPIPQDLPVNKNCFRNEQVRASYMLREAYRERQEKISALQTQLECKNLAGLMYVLCSERRKCKLEKMRIVEG